MVLNESAHTSFPAHALADADPGEDILELVRTLPLLILYCGFVKHEVEGVRGVWMRTYGAPLLHLPDFAALAVDHSEGERYFGIFENILTYLRESKAQLGAGHTMQIGQDEYLRFRAPSAQEPFLSGETEPLVAEIIGADEINR